MSDMSSMNRENKKRQLRRQMISSDMPKPGPGIPQEDSEEVMRRAQKKARRWRGIRFLILLLLIGALAAGWAITAAGTAIQ